MRTHNEHGTKEPETILHPTLEMLAAKYRPSSYLEIGVREGHSLQRVLRGWKPSRIVLADLWTGTHGGTNRGSSDHISNALKELGIPLDTVEFLDGDSKMTIPTVDEAFDMVLVDGDHTHYGAWRDLNNVWEVLRPGGILVFDDILLPGTNLWLTWLQFLSTLDPGEIASTGSHHWSPHGVAWLERALF